MVNADILGQLQSRVRASAAAIGFAAIGFASPGPDPVRVERLATWLGDGNHGSMDWMEARRDQRASPRDLWPEARSVIALGVSYATDRDPLALADEGDRGRISVYAQGRDYHDVVKKMLKRLARAMVEEAEKLGLDRPALKVFVDTAPVMEKPLGEAAGLGWQGKHTNLISRDHGNWLFLGAIYTELSFVPDDAGTDRCGSCTKCQNACPTDAFPTPYVLDARRCISYLTIEHKGEIPHEFRKAIGNRIYGCDDCLAVCPWNKFASAAAAHRQLLPRAELAAPELADLLTLDDAGFRSLFSGSPIKRIGRNRFVRNCLIAAGNSKNASILVQIQPLIDDPDPVVAEAARWASAQIGAQTGSKTEAGLQGV